MSIILDTEHFVIGNGAITCVVEWNRAPDRDAYGLLLGIPGRLPRKESTLLWHPEHRLRRTMLAAIVDGVRYLPEPDTTFVRWGSLGDVIVEWRAGPAAIVERLRILSLAAMLSREVIVRAPVGSVVRIEAALYANPTLFDDFAATDRLVARGVAELALRNLNDAAALGDATAFERFYTTRACTIAGEPGDHFRLDYVVRDDDRLEMRREFGTRFSYEVDAPHFHRLGERIRRRYLAASGDRYEAPAIRHEPAAPPIERMLFHARRGLRAAIGFDGRFNASLFQYEFEWGIDAAMVASAAALAGDHALAAEVLDNIFTRLASIDGAIAEAGRFRGAELSELNGNGAVLDAVARYHRITGDDGLVRDHWPRIVAVAEYLLRDEFSHESGLLRTRRDFWERFPWQGVGDGFELGHQVYASVGLDAAAELATHVGDARRALRWTQAATRIRTATLEHPTHRLIEDGRFIRRRLVDGTHEMTLVADATWRREEYAPYLPATYDTSPRPCEPDITEILPILYELVDPHSDVARATLEAIEDLWSPNGIGGYARYNVASEPDSPGPWPFATAMVAAAELAAGLEDRADRSIAWLLDAAGSGGSWLEFHGDRASPPLPPVGIIVWAWAQYILLVVEHVAGVRVGRDHVAIRPRRAGLSLSLRLGAHALHLRIDGTARARVDGVEAPLDGGGLFLSLPLTEDHDIVFT